MRLSADIDVRGAIAEVRATGGAIRPKAIVPALNRTIRRVRTVASREIAQEMGRPFTSRLVLRALRFTTAQPITLTATLRARGREVVSLSRYGGRKTKTGYRVKVRGRTYDLAHAFRPRNGKQVFIRAAAGKAQEFTELAYQPGGRLPIARLVAPGIPRTFRDRRVLGVMERTVELQFPIELARAARLSLAQLSVRR